MTCPSDMKKVGWQELSICEGSLEEGHLTVSFIIPAWNHYNLLMQCLESIDRLADQGFEIIVVDNGSEQLERDILLQDPLWKNRIQEDESEGSVLPIKKNHEGVQDGRPRSDGMMHLIRLSENTGFSHAVNIGIQAAAGNLIILLNNDIVLESGFIGAVRQAMVQHPEWLHAAAKIRQYHHPELLDDAGNALLTTGRSVKIGYAERDAGQYDALHTVFSACGAAAVYRKTFFEQVGLFDEDFFAYLEDVDLGFRAQRMGFICGWIPNAVCRHIGSATTGSMKNTFTVRLLAQNQVCMLVKNLPATLWMLLGIPIGCTMLAQWFKYVCNRNGNGKAYREGLISGFKQIGKMRRKRIAAKAAWKQSSLDLLKQLISGGRLYRTSKKKRVSI